MPKQLAANDVPRLLRPGMNVYVQGSSMEPQAIITALKSNPDSSRGVQYITVAVPNVNRTDFAALADDASATVFFMTPEMRPSYERGKIRYVPCHFSHIESHIGRIHLDLAIVQLSEPDASGHCSTGTSADFVWAAINRAATVVAELNSAVPAGIRGPKVPLSALNYTVSTSHPLALLALPDPDLPTRAAAQHAAELIGDGDTLQIGVGRLPAAVLGALEHHRDLGLHSGIIGDAALSLIEKGVVTNGRKPIDPGTSIAAAALGTERLYAALAHYPVELRPVRYTHSQTVLSRIPNLVSINSALEIDLTGQVNTESIDYHVVAGTGGFVDFVRGAGASPGGRSIIVLESTARQGQASRIVPFMRPSLAVTSLRTDTDYVVTEHGVAYLRDLSLSERARALIAIAHPRFRESLQTFYDRAFLGDAMLVGWRPS